MDKLKRMIIGHTVDKGKGKATGVIVGNKAPRYASIRINDYQLLTHGYQVKLLRFDGGGPKDSLYKFNQFLNVDETPESFRVKLTS